jgi:hypothetical protein
VGAHDHGHEQGQGEKAQALRNRAHSEGELIWKVVTSMNSFDRSPLLVARSLPECWRLSQGLLASPTGDAKRKHKHKAKAKKAKPNEFGCLSVGKACKSDDQCCTGICEGKQDKKCRAHDTGTCDQKADDFCAAPSQDTLCNGSPTCACVRTTAGSTFCVDTSSGASACADCQNDANCEALGFPPGSACAPFTEGVCAGMCEGDMACVVPCGFQPPES